MDSSDEVIQMLARAVASISVGHPARVAVDGRSAAGKTTLADKLAKAVHSYGREVVRASIDDFHRTDHRERRRVGWTPQSYYDQGYDYQTFTEFMLDPLGPGGNRSCRTKFYDSLNDRQFPETWISIRDQAVAIVDGIFLLRPGLADRWDFIIWLDIDMETMVQRARDRDVEWVGSVTEVEDRYRRHWIPTHELYERLDSPVDRAHAVIDNRFCEEPRIIRFSVL
ncbi:uridine kinase [soil metagenome]